MLILCNSVNYDSKGERSKIIAVWSSISEVINSVKKPYLRTKVHAVHASCNAFLSENRSKMGHSRHRSEEQRILIKRFSERGNIKNKCGNYRPIS